MTNKDRLIWYVSYGSNLCYRRFLLYIAGGKDEELRVKEDGCNDKTPPRDSRVITIPYRLYFGNRSGKWDGGGVCFVKTKRDKTSKTIARAYLITYEQYLEVCEQEGNSPRWYGNQMSLEPIDGIETKTLTSYTDNQRSIPSEAYIDVVKKGLKECGLTEQEAIEYIKKHIE